jgi:hypothetical protein
LPSAAQVVGDRQHKKTHLAGTRVPLGVPPHVASVAVQSGGKRRSGTTRL